MSAPSQAKSSAPSRSLRLGFLALTDAAPLVVAQELGLFADHGLRVQLGREVGWATIRDKVAFGELDAAPAPAPMLWATQLGLGGAPMAVCTGLVLNLHGNAITLSERLWTAGVRDAATLRAEALSRRGEKKLTFGIVFPFSHHHLLLRQWLQAARLDPERDVRIAVVPPAQMFRNLAAGTLDGYCVGEPWNTLAVQEGIRSIAFPAISCGVYGYPKEQAVQLAVDEVERCLEALLMINRVIFACFDNEMADLYRQALASR